MPHVPEQASRLNVKTVAAPAAGKNASAPQTVKRILPVFIIKIS
jgi:hypothetical protein